MVPPILIDPVAKLFGLILLDMVTGYRCGCRGRQESTKNGIFAFFVVAFCFSVDWLLRRIQMQRKTGEYGKWDFGITVSHILIDRKAKLFGVIKLNTDTDA